MGGVSNKSPASKLPESAGGTAKATPTKTPSKASDTPMSNADEDIDACSPAQMSKTSPKKRTADHDENAPRVRAKRTKKNTKVLETVRPTKLMPTFMSGPNIALTNASGAAISNDYMNVFNSTVYEIVLGDSEFKFHGHESVLSKSPKFREAIDNAKGKKRRAPRQCLQFDGYDAGAFSQMLNWLYKDKFTLMRTTDIPARLRELTDLMELAKIFKLPALQKLVVNSFAKSQLINKCEVTRFFDWAEDMFYAELDQSDGPFIRFFAKEAPLLLQAYVLDFDRRKSQNTLSNDEAPEDTLAGLVRQARDGNEFAGELFKAMFEALVQTKSIIKMKKESKSAAQARANASGTAAARGTAEEVKSEMTQE